MSRDPIELYGCSCDAGFATACYLLGTSLGDAPAGSEAATRAGDAFERACRFGHSKACGIMRR